MVRTGAREDIRPRSANDGLPGISCAAAAPGRNARTSGRAGNRCRRLCQALNRRTSFRMDCLPGQRQPPSGQTGGDSGASRSRFFRQIVPGPRRGGSGQAPRLPPANASTLPLLAMDGQCCRRLDSSPCAGRQYPQSMDAGARRCPGVNRLITITQVVRWPAMVPGAITGADQRHITLWSRHLRPRSPRPQCCRGWPGNMGTWRGPRPRAAVPGSGPGRGSRR